MITNVALSYDRCCWWVIVSSASTPIRSVNVCLERVGAFRNR